VAAKSSHLDAVELLLEAGAKPSAKDKYGRSALFYAARLGDVEIVFTLLHSKPSTNDGSLHEAARSFHAPVMELLLKAGHDADYRSTKHGGRTALGEMALKGRVSEDVARTEEAVDLLKDAGSDPMVKVDGKTVIFLALDNKNPEPVVRVLLDVCSFPIPPTLKTITDLIV
jgi:ankyrin repeat protein